MVLSIENILLIGSILLFISILAGKTSYRFGVPTLILFLAIGMLAGTEGVAEIHFNDPKIAQFIGIVALNFILFSGGLDTDWKTIKPILGQGITLSTVGVLITATTVGTFIWFITDFTFYEGMLLGAIVSSTDAAAVFSILRSKNLCLKNNLRPTLELESGSNDPMAYFLTIAFTGLVVNEDKTILSIIPMFFQQIILGGLFGIGFGKISKFFINKLKLDFEGLYPVLGIAIMFFTFSATDFIGGNGFLAVYLCGVYLGNQDLIHKNAILKAFDGYAWLMQIVLFLTLGLLVYPSHIVPVIGIGLLISIFLILVARPLSVFISLVFFKVTWRGKMFLSWVGLRGAVPIVFATYPLIAGIEKADMIFNIVFFIALTSVIVQGTTLSTFAHWLKVSLESKKSSAKKADEFYESFKSVMVEIKLPGNTSVADKKIVELGFPKTAIIAMIQRNGKYITPNGATSLEPNDKLLILSENKKTLSEIYACLEMKQA